MTLIGSVISFSDTLSVAGPLVIQGGTPSGPTGIILDTVGLIALRTTAPGSSILLNGNTVLRSDAEIDSNGGDITQLGTLNGGFDFTLDTGGDGVIGIYGSSVSQSAGSIGGTALLRSMSLTSGTIYLQPDINTSGDQTYTADKISRVGAGRSRSLGAGTVTFNGPLSAVSGMALGVTGSNVQFNGPVAINSKGLAVTANQVRFGGGSGSVTGPGSISLTGATTGQTLVLGGVTADAYLSNADLAAFASGSTAMVLTVSGTGMIDIEDGTVFNHPVKFVTGAGGKVVAGELSGTDGSSLSFAGATNILNGDITTDGGAVSIGVAKIGADITVASSGGNVNFTSTVNDATAGLDGLTVQAGGGNITFAGTIGKLAPIATLHLQSSGTTTIQNTLATGSLLTDAGGITRLYSSMAGGATGGFDFGNAVQLFGAISIKSAGGVNFDGAVTSSGTKRTLAISSTTSGISFASSVGDAGLASVTLTGTSLAFTSLTAGTVTVTAPAITGDSVTTTGKQTYTGALALTGSLNASSLAVTSPENITQGAAWHVLGGVVIKAPGRNITLDQDNTFGSLQLTGNNVTVNNDAATVLSTSWINGSLAVSSTGAITNTGALNVSGRATFISGSSISLTYSSNHFLGEVNFAPGGSNNVLFTNNTGTILGALNLGGNLTVRSGGNITQGAGDSLIVSGTTLLLGGGSASINLPGASNQFGVLGMTGKNASVNSASDLHLASTSLSGSLGLIVNGTVDQSGSLSAATGSSIVSAQSGADIVLTGSQNTLGGPVSFTTSGDGSVFLNVNKGIKLGATSIGGDLTVTNAKSGNITQSGVLSVLGNVSLTDAPGTILLSNSANLVGGVVSLVANTVSWANTGTLNLGTSSAVSDFVISSSGAISQSGSLSVGRTLNITSGGAIQLDDAGNHLTNLGTVKRGGALVVNDSDGGLNLIGAITAGTVNNDVTITTVGNLVLVSRSAARIAGAHVTLAATSGNFVNNIGSSVIQINSGGRWLIYSTSKNSIVKGGLLGVPEFEKTYPDAADPQNLSSSFIYANDAAN